MLALPRQRHTEVNYVKKCVDDLVSIQDELCCLHRHRLGPGLQNHDLPWLHYIIYTSLGIIDFNILLKERPRMS